MEEIEVLKSIALDEYLNNDKYGQIEDLLAVCVVNLSASLTGILEAVFAVRGTGKNPNLKEVAADLQNIVQHIAVMTHCLDVNIPEFEEIEEFIDEEMDDESRMDVTMCLLSIQHIFSNMVLEYYVSALEPENEDLVDNAMMQVGVLDMLSSVMCICIRYKLDFAQVIVQG